jgi:aldose sugar dehydrogenase
MDGHRGWLRSRSAALAVLVALTGRDVAVSSSDHRDPFTVDVIARGLKTPSAIAFLPDGRALVLERASGTADLVDVKSGTVTPLAGLPPVLTGDDAGLHDVVLHPEFDRNGWIYLSYSEGEPSRSTTVVDRMHLRGHEFVDRQRLLTSDAYSEDRYHYGGRLAIKDGYLFVTIGDRHHERRAQELTTHAGKILRVRDDGTVPEDNPFVRTTDARGEIWSYGHRHPQGIAFDAAGVLWEHEHGPLGGDELNVIEKGANYGWPVISYGWQYEGGPVGQGIVAHEGMKQPLWVWTPSLAPSGMLWYRGSAFPQWRGHILIGGMGARVLEHLTIRGSQVVAQERWLTERHERIRCLAEAPDGRIFLGDDDGEILRLSPM